MNEQEFTTFLKSISNYDEQDDILLKTISFINKYYEDFQKEVESNFHDKLNEFDVFGNETAAVVGVQNYKLRFGINSKDNFITVEYNNEEKDKLYIENKKVISEKYKEEISKNLLESYLDLFNSMKNE